MRCCHVFSSATFSRFRLECDATAVSQPGSATTSFRKLQRGAVTFSLRSHAGHASCRPVVGKDTSHDSLAGRPGTAANRCKRAVSIAPAQVPRSSGRALQWPTDPWDRARGKRVAVLAEHLASRVHRNFFDASDFHGFHAVGGLLYCKILVKS